MKLWIRIFSFLLCMLLSLPLLSACRQEEEPLDTSSDSVASSEESSSESETEQAPALLDRNEANDTASEFVRTTLQSFRNRVWTKTGVELPIKTDKTAATSREILISMMDGRSEPQEELAKLTAPQKKGFRVCTIGEKIVVAATEEYLEEALNLLFDAVCDCGNDVWGIPKDYFSVLDIPALPKEGQLYYAGEGNYAYNLTNVSTRTVNDFINQIESDGFKRYTSNTIGSSEFQTYIKDSIHSRMVVYVMYHPTLKTLRLTYGPMEYLPNATPIQAANAIEPTITQMHMEMVDNGFGKDNIVNNTTGAPGMSYLLQLSDGRFIVIDGGNADGTITPAVQDDKGHWSIGEEIQTKDSERLYKKMRELQIDRNKPPTIAVWFISHAHGDHMLLATDFLYTYKDKISLELVAFNFLDVPSTKLPTIMLTWENNFRSRVQQYFPDAQTWIMHTGQQLFLPGCEIEVFATAEDFLCTGSPVTDGNNICAVYRITLGNTSFMVLGDAYPVTSEFMRDAYGTALESDILQLSHHGFEGSGMTAGFYQYINPKICFWPCDEFRFRMDPRTLGTHGAFPMNYWLRNSKWTRGTESGVREHYTSSYTTTINADTGKKIPSKS